jgi:hypothetical protein
MTIADQLREQIRLAILQTLEAAPAYTLHEYLLLEQVRGLGLGTTRDALRTELAWLEETGLLEVQDLGAAVTAHLSDRGQDAAKGYAQIPGVARPRP